jgi:ditrans,polycis-polyprenyl diphosphate synthase
MDADASIRLPRQQRHIRRAPRAMSAASADAPQVPPVAAAGATRRSSVGGVAGALRRVAAAVLRAGPVPRHVAFIMDGNRRFADAHGWERAQGHARGFDRVRSCSRSLARSGPGARCPPRPHASHACSAVARFAGARGAQMRPSTGAVTSSALLSDALSPQLVDCLEWCLELGVEVVSVYAFSIENFRRDAAEVESLMSLAERKLDELLDSAPQLRARRARVRVLGDLGLLPARVAAAAARVAAATSGAEHAAGPRINICLAYTARAELAGAAAAVHAALRAGRLAAADVSEALLEACLLTADEGGCPPVGLLLRTSGERRLSDFLLHQAGHALLVFQDVLWPDLSFRHLAVALLRYQRAAVGLADDADAERKGRLARRRRDALAAMRAAAAQEPSSSCADANDDDSGEEEPPAAQPYAGDDVAQALLARYGPAVAWHGRGRPAIADDDDDDEAPATAAERAALDAAEAASARRCAAFLQAREAAAAAWMRAAATGKPPPWPPALLES